MNDIVNLILNSGVTVVVIGYFMYRDYKFMGKLEITLGTLVTTVDLLKQVVVSHDN